MNVTKTAPEIVISLSLRETDMLRVLLTLPERRLLHTAEITFAGNLWKWISRRLESSDIPRAIGVE